MHLSRALAILFVLWNGIVAFDHDVSILMEKEETSAREMTCKNLFIFKELVDRWTRVEELSSPHVVLSPLPNPEIWQGCSEKASGWNNEYMEKIRGTCILRQTERSGKHNACMKVFAQVYPDQMSYAVMASSYVRMAGMREIFENKRKKKEIDVAITTENKTAIFKKIFLTSLRHLDDIPPIFEYAPMKRQVKMPDDQALVEKIGQNAETEKMMTHWSEEKVMTARPYDYYGYMVLLNWKLVASGFGNVFTNKDDFELFAEHTKKNRNPFDLTKVFDIEATDIYKYSFELMYPCRFELPHAKRDCGPIRKAIEKMPGLLQQLVYKQYVYFRAIRELMLSDRLLERALDHARNHNLFGLKQMREELLIHFMKEIPPFKINYGAFNIRSRVPEVITDKFYSPLAMRHEYKIMEELMHAEAESKPWVSMNWYASRYIYVACFGGLIVLCLSILVFACSLDVTQPSDKEIKAVLARGLPKRRASKKHRRSSKSKSGSKSARSQSTKKGTVSSSATSRSAKSSSSSRSKSKKSSRSGVSTSRYYSRTQTNELIQQTTVDLPEYLS